MRYTSLRIDTNTLILLKEIKTRMEKEYVKPLSFDFVLKKIIEKEERRIIILNQLAIPLLILKLILLYPNLYDVFKYVFALKP